MMDFRITEYPFEKDYLPQINQDRNAVNYPVVYIIFDDKKQLAYIGESTNVQGRMNQHLQHPEKRKLKYLYVVSSPYFNKSAALDIESNLIQYFTADATFKLLNANAGISAHNFYQKPEYFELFSQLWETLKLKKVVKKDLLALDNSDIFKYSPYKALSVDQNLAIQEILNILKQEDSAHIFVQGSAGTGKTILAIYLIKLLNSKFDLSDYEDKETEVYQLLESIVEMNQIKVGLVVPMTSLRNTLKTVFGSIPGLKKSMVIGPTEVAKQKYDLLIVDEAHRLKRRKALTGYGAFDNVNRVLDFDKEEGTELDWILKQSTHQVFFYDAAQSIRPTDIPEERFKALKSSGHLIPLRSQMRVKSGNDYIKFVRHLFHPEHENPYSPFKDDQYELKVYDHLQDMLDALQEKEDQVGLSRVVAGYAWPWISKNNPELADAEIDGVSMTWNRSYQDWIHSALGVNEMGCIHTTQGYDLNYVGVIIGKDIGYDPVNNKIFVRKDNYFDAKGKQKTSEEDLKEYIINIYKTLMYRGIRGCYLYVCDDGLREYMKENLATNF